MEDLTELGYEVVAPDLPGCGDGPPLTGGESIDDLAAAAADRLGGRVDLLVGHSLGAILGLLVATRRPDLVGGLLLLDPPSPVDAEMADAVAADLADRAAAAAADPVAAAAALLVENPRWTARDAAGTVAGHRSLQRAEITRVVRGWRWRLPELVAACPAPVRLLAATAPGSALLEPDRSAVIDRLGPERVTVVVGGHGPHRDRPALVLRAVLGALDEVLAARS